MNIKTWDSFLDKRKRTNNKTIGIFSSEKKLPSSANEWDRAMVIDGNTREYSNKKWIDLGTVIMPIGLAWAKWDKWETGNDWVTPNKTDIANILFKMFDKPKDWLNGKDWVAGRDGKDWKDWKDWADAVVDYNKLTTMVMNKIYDDKKFIESIRWKDWVDWVDGRDGKDWLNGKDGVAPTALEIVSALLINQSFLEKCKVKWEKGDKGDTVDLRDIVFTLKQDEEFIKSCTVKWDKWDKWDMFLFENLTATQIELLRWPKWDVGQVWAKWVDWDKLLIMYSPDGKNNVTYRFKDWDKFIHISYGKTTNIFQIIFN